MCYISYCLVFFSVLFINCMFLSCHAFQSESALHTIYRYLSVKELLAQNRQKIWGLCAWNWTRIHNNLVCKQTLNHLTKLTSLAKLHSVRLQTERLWVRVKLQSLSFLSWFPCSTCIPQTSINLTCVLI